MNKRVRQAALKLMLLQEEFTKDELDEAAILISSGEKESLLEFLSAATTSRRKQQDSAAASNGISKAVEDLKDSDPQRFQLLAEFERLLRREKILPTLDDIRKLGLSLSKDFQPAKSRKESIPRLMVVLKGMPVDDLREKLSNVVESSSATNDDEAYQQLARFLIVGSQKS